MTGEGQGEGVKRGKEWRGKGREGKGEREREGGTVRRRENLFHEAGSRRP